MTLPGSLPVTSTTLPPVQARPQGQSSQPTEQYAGTTSAPPPEATLRAQARDQARRAALAGALLAPNGPGAPDAEQRASLVGSLSKVDPAILELAGKHDLRISVVNPGDDPLQNGAMQPRSFEDYQRRLPQMRAAADKAAAVAAGYDAKLEALTAKQSAQKPQGFSLNQSAADQQKFLLTLREKPAAESKALGDSGAIRFTLPKEPGADMGMGMGGLGMGMAPAIEDGPHSTKQMAALVGAKTPEQFKEYETLMQGINGKRLTQAREEALKGFSDNIATLPPEKQAEAKAMLAHLRSNPGEIPLFNRDKHHIYAPDLFYREDSKGQSVRLNLHDAGSLKSWAGPDGKSQGSWDPKSNPQGSPVDGQFFPDSRRILLQGSLLKQGHPGEESGHGDTPVHELGHGIQDIVRKRDPKFHDAWEKKLQAAYDKAGGPMGMGGNGMDWVNPNAPKPPGTVTGYALRNTNEYLAEGVSFYYDDPKLLKAKDPTLYKLTHEFLEHAKTLK